MNMHKHMETIFVVTLAVVSAGTFALDSLREADAGQTALAARDSEVANARAIVVMAPTLPKQA